MAVVGKIVVGAAVLTGVDEDSLIRRVEAISKKMYRFYDQVKKKSDRSQQAARELQKKVSQGKRTYRYVSFLSRMLIALG